MVSTGKTKAPEMASISLPVELVRKLRILTTHRGWTIYGFVTPLIAKTVEREYRKAVNEMNDTGESGC